MTITVNKQDWNALSSGEQAEISNIIGSSFTGETVEAAEGAAATADVGSVCTIACTLAQAAATTLCNKISNPLAQQVCLMAAQAAGSACLKRC